MKLILLPVFTLQNQMKAGKNLLEKKKKGHGKKIGISVNSRELMGIQHSFTQSMLNTSYESGSDLFGMVKQQTKQTNSLVIMKLTF